MIDYKEKIRKLLQLAESPNEYEAKAALLKAQQLMAEHKIKEPKAEKGKGQKVESRITDITCSKRRNPWVMQLASIIGESYCCRACQASKKGKQTYMTGFIGFEEDVEICTNVFEYAVDCILARIAIIKKKNKNRYDAGTMKQICDSYGYGFAAGIESEFTKQKEEKGWGLVLVTPKEVNDAAERLINGEVKCHMSIHKKAYNSGYKRGKQFDPKARIEGD